MKTQINTLVSGLKNQFLNENKDYSIYSETTSHCNHSGSNRNDVDSIWNEITQENEDYILISLLYKKMTLKMTINEIRENIIRTERCVVVGYDEETKKETKKALSFKYNDILLNVIDKGDFLLIWK